MRRRKYEHKVKAGNRGDVWKHAILVVLADRVTPGGTFILHDTHAGAPMHELAPNGEWTSGIRAALGRVTSPTSYFELAQKHVDSGCYPSGWRFFAIRASRRVDRLQLRLHDTDEAVARHYEERLSLVDYPTAEILFTQCNGFESLSWPVSPDLVFLDPPYSPNAAADWKAVADACLHLQDARIPYAAWYPFFWPTKPQQLVDRTGQVSFEVHWSSCGEKPSQNLKGCGMLVSPDLLPLLESAQSELQVTADALLSDLVRRVPVSD